MKYKIGDKVRIRTWEDMEKEYGLNEGGNIKASLGNNLSFIDVMEKKLNRKFPDRILTIKEIKYSNYKVEEMAFGWTEDMIECLAKDYVEIVPIHSRFEILDIR